MIIIITPPYRLPDEEAIVNRLFENGLHILHLRKPNAGRATYEQFIRKIAPRFRPRVIIHDHFDLARAYGLKGIHLNATNWDNIEEIGAYAHVTTSCHSFEEIANLPFTPDYVFLSPIFDSISKKGYASPFTPGTLREGLRETPVQVVALGGINADNAIICRRWGFRGVALLGYIWENPPEALSRFLKIFPPETLSIAGFDPSSGAGVTADIKTFEDRGVYGLGVASAITFQNQNEYLGTKWMTPEEIIRQCEVLFRAFTPAYVKIGLIESFNTLTRVVDYLSTALPRAKIIWDPILKASAGSSFHDGEKIETIERILRKIYLITPNRYELETLFTIPPEPRALQEICRRLNTRILWKGGHNDETLSSDRLITSEGVHTFSVARGKHEKHGTGCLLSSAIASFLTLGYSLQEACHLAQRCTSDLIGSNDTNLGTRHRIETALPANLHALPLQYITDHKRGTSIPEQVEHVCQGGCRWIQLRMKDASREQFMQTAVAVKEICRRYGALFLVNDRVDMALALDADGVHLGKEDISPREARETLGYSKIIGATCNTFDDILESDRQQVDYIGLGPFRFTSTKKRLSPVLGVEGYRSIAEKCRTAGICLPIHAIGGIRADDIPSLLAAGVTGIALSSLLKEADDIAARTREIIEIINQSRHRSEITN